MAVAVVGIVRAIAVVGGILAVAVVARAQAIAVVAGALSIAIAGRVLPVAVVAGALSIAIAGPAMAVAVVGIVRAIAVVGRALAVTVVGRALPVAVAAGALSIAVVGRALPVAVSVATARVRIRGLVAEVYGDDVADNARTAGKTCHATAERAWCGAETRAAPAVYPIGFAAGALRAAIGGCAAKIAGFAAYGRRVRGTPGSKAGAACRWGRRSGRCPVRHRLTAIHAQHSYGSVIGMTNRDFTGLEIDNVAAIGGADLEPTL